MPITGGMKVRNTSDWVDPDSSADLFVDRIDEARALDASLREHRARIDADTLTMSESRNLLMYYGDGGVGKTELSSRLQAWLTGTGSPAGEYSWGFRPGTSVDAIVRWDFNDSYGSVDVVDLLIGLRVQLGSVRRSWPAFDLAFADLFRMMRPGDDLTLRTPGHAQTTLSEVVGGLVSDAIAVTDISLTGGAGAATFGIGRRVLAGAYARSKARRAVRDFPQVAEVLHACEKLPGSPRDLAIAGARAAFLLSCEIHAMDPRRRPLVVVFMDHFERLQIAGQAHAGEWTLNKMIARLPYFLFVASGRNSLQWHDPGATHVDERGLQRWPLLATAPTPADEPHQHRVGNLSQPDARRFLETAFAREGVTVDGALVEQLAEATDGWPLHLDTLVAVASDRAQPDRQLTAHDLSGPLPRLVDRLLAGLPNDQSDAFRAACLLPYFDLDFVAAAGEVSLGAVERLTARTIVRDNPSSRYPYRVHETLRELVREAGSSAEGGWAKAEWAHRAGRALEEAERRFESAMDLHDDLAANESLALGLNVAAEHGVYDDWLVPAIRRAPSLDSLGQLLPTANPRAAAPAVADILDFLRLRTPSRDDVTEALRDVIRRRSPISSTAGLWLAYDLRFRGQTDAALAQLEELLSDFGDRPGLYAYQMVVTLRLARRFRDAMERLPDLTETQRRRTIGSVNRGHGRFLTADTDVMREVADNQKSRRYQVEVLGDWLLVKHRESGVSIDTAMEVYEQADRIGHRSAQADAASVIGQMQIFDDEVFSLRAAELEELSNRRSRPYASWTMLLALRAWACEEPEHARRAQQVLNKLDYRSTAYIPIEVLLEEMGFAASPQSSQWLDPYEEVRRRWMGVHRAVTERARGNASGPT